MNSNLSGLLGICRRAGHLTVGFDAVRELILCHRAALVLIADDLSEKTAKEIRFLVREHPESLAALPLTKTALAATIGYQKPIGVIAIADKGFATAIRKHIPAALKEDDAL